MASKSALSTTPPAVVPATIKILQKTNKNGPASQFQVNKHLLYEYEFPGQTFVSAHLQRLQHGVFSHDNLHNDCTTHVTFAAITFTFHPARSLHHRFASAVITITANEDREGKDSQLPVRFLRFAPHVAFGRISSATLKWNFQLGATIGVTKGPAEVSVNPSMGYEKDVVIGAMLKIQGSTRSTSSQHHRHLSGGASTPSKLPDTKMVWTLEENDEQHTGLPREFTFVFLMERSPATPKKPNQAPGSNHPIEEARGSTSSTMDPDYHEVFTPLTFTILVQPEISGKAIEDFIHAKEECTSIVGEQVGQRFPTGSCRDEEELVNGLYNFAKMPGDFEDLVELPGNSMTSVEPTLSDTPSK